MSYVFGDYSAEGDVYSTLGAAVEAFQAASSSAGDLAVGSLWFKWTSTSPGILTLNTQGTYWPASLAVYRDAPGLGTLRKAVGISSRCPFSNVTGTQAFPPSCVSIVVPAAGVTLAIQALVDANIQSTAATGNLGRFLTLNWATTSISAPQVVNDMFASRATLAWPSSTTSVISVTGSTSRASFELDELSSVYSSRATAPTVYYKITAGSTGSVDMQVVGGNSSWPDWPASAGPADIWVYVDGPGNSVNVLSAVGTESSGCPLTPAEGAPSKCVRVPMTKSVTYVIQVVLGPTPQFTLAWRR